MAIQIEIIKEATPEKPFLVIYKPKGLPSAPLSADDKNNALSQALEAFPELDQVHGKKEIEYGLLHRLDTATDGLMVIAATQECYDFLSNEQREGRFIKTYSAQCDIIPDNAELLGGYPPAPSLRGAPATKQSIIDHTFIQRLYPASFLRDKLIEIGFSEADVFGDYDRSPYDEHARTMVIIARK